MKDHLPSRLLAPVVAVTAVGLTAYLYLRPALIRDPSATKPPAPARSPKWTVLPSLSTLQRDELPYPPDLLPGGRDVDTPYGSLRVYEWGPKRARRCSSSTASGRRASHSARWRGRSPTAAIASCSLTFLGAATPTAHRTCRTMGVSTTPSYTFALASSSLPWSGAGRFPTSSATLSARHRRLTPRPVLDDDVAGESDATGGATFDNALLDLARPELTVARVIRWQLAAHPGFVPAYRSTIRWAPIYGQGQGEWAPLRGILEERRAGRVKNGLRGGRVCFVVGETDPVIVAGELEQDARLMLGEDAVDMRVVKGTGHEVGITRGREVAGIAMRYWQSIQAAQSCS
ncbi:conserved hypothetical protein [Verticillium alfalfae VaMs.102]|uniref:Alpha/beta hydrolase n=1 Tax=Verticillium alfalfae (strain VaMs.102 / ATCC MYA-4576 / FGSC 10136) TaxID=526221 RepID=C9SFB5_VERA1|nr:conserved hypothetical protein [Verticillium alfalfae VaMs.102]EEY17901.1 conserved hypothetical protein [Verticillium alfalfae VaMs.102]